jgi:hypothetical protein
MTFLDLSNSQKSQIIRLILSTYSTALRRQRFFTGSQAHDSYGLSVAGQRAAIYLSQIQSLYHILKTIAPNNATFLARNDHYKVDSEGYPSQ